LALAEVPGFLQQSDEKPAVFEEHVSTNSSKMF
jgi:hypothetical protein